MANRLTEVPDWKVLLIEAGGPEHFLMDIPIVANFLQFSQANWKYRTQPSTSSCLGMKGGRCHWPRGKVMGGSSVLNYMIYTKGNRRDFDEWEAMGNKGKTNIKKKNVNNKTNQSFLILKRNNLKF